MNSSELYKNQIRAVLVTGKATLREVMHYRGIPVVDERCLVAAAKEMLDAGEIIILEQGTSVDSVYTFSIESLLLA